jgi:hypothetical protein
MLEMLLDKAADSGFIRFFLRIGNGLSTPNSSPCAQYLFYLYYLILGADISVPINCFGNMEPQMNADKRRCKIPLRRMTPASKGAPAFSYLWALR